MPQLDIGANIDGRFVIAEKLLDNGVFVFARATTETQETVYLQVLQAEVSQDEFAAVEAEFYKLGSPRFAYKLPMQDLVSHPGNLLIQTYSEYPPQTLAEAIAADATSAAAWLRAVTESLFAFHNAGLIHGNLDHDSLRVGNNKAYVIGFGAAPLIASRNRQVMKSWGSTLAPEIGEGEPPSPMSDIYSLGIIVTKIAPRLRDSEWAKTACNKDPSLRFINMREAGSALQTCLEELEDSTGNGHTSPPATPSGGLGEREEKSQDVTDEIFPKPKPRDGSNIVATHSVHVQADPPPGGGVTGSGNYARNERVKLTAEPNAGYVFVGWSGSVTGSQNPMMVTVGTREISVTAHFRASREEVRPKRRGSGTVIFLIVLASLALFLKNRQPVVHTILPPVITSSGGTTLKTIVRPSAPPPVLSTYRARIDEHQAKDLVNDAQAVLATRVKKTTDVAGIKATVISDCSKAVGLSDKAINEDPSHQDAISEQAWEHICDAYYLMADYQDCKKQIAKAHAVLPQEEYFSRNGILSRLIQQRGK